MRAIFSWVTLSFAVWLISACAPKISQNTSATPAQEQPNPVQTPSQDQKLSPCATFDDAPSKEDATTQYVLYRDFLKAGDWTQAYDYWKQVFAVAPAADGKRNTLFADGIRFYEHFYTQTTDSLQKEAWIDKIFELYQGLDSCFHDGGYATARKAFDLYYKYPHRASREEVLSMFQSAIEQDSNLMRDFIINPFTALLVEQYDAGKVSLAEAQKYDRIIRNSLAKGLADCEGAECDRWKVVQEYAPQRLEYFETVKGFYDCSFFKSKYYAEFEAAPEDCDVIRNVYSYLRWGGCAEDDPQMAALIRKGNELCVERERGPASVAYECLRNADYRCAIDGFTKAADESSDPVTKGNYLLTAGKIYYAHLKNFSKARQTFLQAAEARPNWGEPYLWIGRLYASSGPLCGPGRGWDSQIVVWPAIDKWEYAKRIDPSCAREANKWITQYEQYMPDRSEIFSRLLKEGDSFTVGCWIQERTTIRAAKTQ
jgi:tetratricopeptide (TPR) repeat protein